MAINTDQICVSGSCLARCDRPGGAACANSTVCNPNTGRCVTGGLALGDQTCTFNAECSSDLCMPLSIAGMSKQVCSQGCGGANDCPIHFGCLSLAGMKLCFGDSLFSPPGTFDVAANGSCSTNNNSCQSGWCSAQTSGQCLETCSREADCSSYGGNCFTYTWTSTSGTNLYDEICVQNSGTLNDRSSCAFDSDCNSGVCDRYTSKCGTHCCTNADCRSSEVCNVYDLDSTTGDIVKLCEPRAGSGTLGLGATCTADTDCTGETCTQVTAGANDPKHCTTLCCTDRDCSGYPGGAKCHPANGPMVGTFSTLIGLCVPP
jgi:hypothetical protein